MPNGIRRIYQRPRQIAWLLVSRNWYLLPAMFLIGISIPMCSEEDVTGGVHPHAIGYEQSVLGNSAGAAVNRITLSFKSRDSGPLVIAFNEDEDRRSFDYVKIERSGERPSGVFEFREGRPSMLEDCPGLGEASSDVLTISHADGFLEVAPEQGDPCIVGLSRFEAPLRFVHSTGNPMADDEPVDILEIEVAGGEVLSTEMEETKDLLHLLPWAVVSGLLVCFLVWLVFLVLLSLLCPLEFYLAHPHWTLLLFSTGAIILVVLFVTAIATPFAQKQLGVGQWYHDFMVHGRIDRESVERASIISNSGCRMAMEKTSTFRIVVLGGSSTQGFPYDACHASTFPSQLQAYFDALTASNRSLTRKDRRCVEVMNLGSVGASLEYRLAEAFEKVVLPYLDPDIVVVKSANNDYYAQKRILGSLHFLFLALMGGDWSWRGVDVGPYQQHLQRIVDLARDQGVKLIFVEEPIQTDFFSGKNPIRAFQTAMAEIAEENRIPFVETQEAFAHPRDRFLFFDFIHLTWMGNKLLADMILEAIERYELFDLSVCNGEIDEGRIR